MITAYILNMVAVIMIIMTNTCTELDKNYLLVGQYILILQSYHHSCPVLSVCHFFFTNKRIIDNM